jgi:hypothetical protein
MPTVSTGLGFPQPGIPVPNVGRSALGASGLSGWPLCGQELELRSPGWLVTCHKATAGQSYVRLHCYYSGLGWCTPLCTGGLSCSSHKSTKAAHKSQKPLTTPPRPECNVLGAKEFSRAQGQPALTCAPSNLQCSLCSSAGSSQAPKCYALP